MKIPQAANVEAIRISAIDDTTSQKLGARTTDADVREWHRSLPDCRTR